MELESLVHDLSPRVIAYCRGLTRDATLAEDAAQDALVALVRRWHRRGAPRSPEAFVFAVARRRALRAVVRRRLLAPFGVDDGPATASEPHLRAEQSSEVERVLGALRCLPRRDRSALLLIAVAELDYRDAASALGVSLPALKMRVHRARRRLAAALDGGE
jgi:RNA polymerase sigma factor (sigma-70 family)